MPKKPKPKAAKPKPGKHNRNPRGLNQWDGNSFRISFARRRRVAGETYSEVLAAIVERFKVHPRTAGKDVTEADRRNAEIADRDIPKLLARNAQRLDALADQAEEAGKVADAVAALREFHRIHGMHAAKKVHVSAEINVAIDVNAVVGILSERGLEALDVLMSEIEAAKARGELVPPAQLEAGSDEDGEEAN